MDGLLLLVMAGLLAAMAMMAGLWAWRRLSRTASLETGARAATIALRASGPHLASGDDDANRSIPRSGSSTGNMPDSPGRAAPAIAVEPPPTGAQAADRPIHAPAGRKVPEEEERREKEPQPCEAEIEVPPPSPPPAEDAPAPTVSVPGNGQTDSVEVELPETVASEQLPETHDRSAVAETDGAVPLGANTAADHDAASPVLDRSDTAETPGAATEAAADGADDPPEERLADDPPGPNQVEAMPDTDTGAGDCGTASVPPPAVEEAAPENAALTGPGSSPDATLERAPEPPAGPAVRSRQPAIHRDRRGKRRTVVRGGAPAEPVTAGPAPTVHSPAEAKLRLSLHPIRRTARLSVVLTRPDGFPARVTVQAAGSHAVEAYDVQRYDDLDLPWTSGLLDGELRLASADGFQWLRSARQVHIFAEDANEPELISVSAARTGTAHTLVCRASDADAVRLAAVSTGSPELQTREHWQGIPDGWMVLSGYTPVQAAAAPLPPGLRPLNPGEGLEISFAGGLAIRVRVYAAGHPPRISITPAPGAASVTIDGEPATLSSDSAWTAPGWDARGQHIVDVVPGPSASYEIAADPWICGGWDFWDAHPHRFGDGAREPWARARICGALIRGPANETVFAAETQPTLVALGARSGATPLRRRDGVAVSVGLMAEPPAFLLSATGPRRTQGLIIWLGLAREDKISRWHDAEWVAAVRSAAARRLPLDQADALGEDAWRKARERARRLRSRRARA